MTNYERIKAMSIEELANWLCEYSSCEKCFVEESRMCKSVLFCEKNFVPWLESEVDKCG